MTFHPMSKFALLVIIYHVGASLPPLPVMQCPVGTSLDSAFFFFEVTPADVSTKLGDYKGKTQDELKTALKLPAGMEDAVTDEEVINRHSVKAAVERIVGSSVSNHLLNRKLLEDHIEDQQLSFPEDLRWFQMFKGFLNPQDVTMFACEAEFHLPEGIF